MLDGRFVAEDLKIVADKVHDYQENYDRQFEVASEIVVIPVVWITFQDVLQHVQAGLAVSTFFFVQDAMKQLQKLFHDYSMALYLFSFASYLEVMLDGRFA